MNRLKEEVIQFYFKGFGSCVYLITIEKIKILIDTSSKECKKELIKDLGDIGIRPKDIDLIIITHNHWDHIENNHLFSNAKIFDIKNINRLPEDLKKKLIIHKVPGHTKDSIAIQYKEILFSGDTIFHDDGIGRFDFPESVPEKIMESVNLLKNLNYKILAPGHI